MKISAIEAINSSSSLVLKKVTEIEIATILIQEEDFTCRIPYQLVSFEYAHFNCIGTCLTYLHSNCLN